MRQVTSRSPGRTNGCQPWPINSLGRQSSRSMISPSTRLMFSVASQENVPTSALSRSAAPPHSARKLLPDGRGRRLSFRLEQREDGRLPRRGQFAPHLKELPLTRLDGASTRRSAELLEKRRLIGVARRPQEIGRPFVENRGEP